MSQKPPPLQGLTCSTGELAFLLDVTPRRVQQLVAEGVIPKADRGRFDLAAAVRAHCAHQRAALNGALGSTNEREARRRKLAAQAALAELELDRRRGALISQRFFHEFMTAAFSRCRAKLLAMPNCIGSRVPPEVRGQVVETTRSEIYNALNELAAMQVTAAGLGDGAEA